MNVKEKPLVNSLLVKSRKMKQRKLYKSFNASKRQGHNMINIDIIKVCVSFVSKPFLLVFTSSIKNGMSPFALEKVNFLLVHKNGSDKPE